MIDLRYIKWIRSNNPLTNSMTLGELNFLSKPPVDPGWKEITVWSMAEAVRLNISIEAPQMGTQRIWAKTIYKQLEVKTSMDINLADVSEVMMIYVLDELKKEIKNKQDQIDYDEGFYCDECDQIEPYSDWPQFIKHRYYGIHPRDQR